MNRRTKVYVTNQGFTGQYISLYPCKDDGLNRYILNLQWKQIKENVVENLDEGALKLEMDEAQALMDRLWSVGLRPTEGKDSAGALAATERHLDDLRTLVFGAVKKPLIKLKT